MGNDQKSGNYQKSGKLFLDLDQSFGSGSGRAQGGPRGPRGPKGPKGAQAAMGGPEPGGSAGETIHRLGNKAQILDRNQILDRHPTT